MKPAAILKQRVRQDIQARTDKVLRELGNPEPPLRLEDVRELLRLDCDYFTSETDGLFQSLVSKLKRGGIQILNRPTLLLDAVKKFDLRALYLPDHKRILIDDTIPKPKHRWLEAHEIGHDLLPWHHDMMLGDDDITPTASTHDKMEAEANYVLTQDKCYRDGELDEGFSSSLTQDRGYPSNEHESAQQTGVFNQNPRSLSARRSRAQKPHSGRVLRHLRLSPQSSAATA